MTETLIALGFVVALIVLLRAIRKERKLRDMMTRDGRRSFESDKSRTGSFLRRTARGR